MMPSPAWMAALCKQSATPRPRRVTTSPKPIRCTSWLRPAKRTVQNFRRQALRELKKIKLAWAGVELHDGAGRLGPRPLTQNSYLQSAENPGGFVNQDQDIGLAKGTAMSNSLPNRVEPLERHQEILSILED